MEAGSKDVSHFRKKRQQKINGIMIVNPCANPGRQSRPGRHHIAADTERRENVTREEYIEKREMERRQLRRSIAKKDREWQAKKEIVNAAIAGMITFLSIIYGILYL